MEKKSYQKPVLRELGSLGGLTMGMSGSIPDGASQNVGPEGMSGGLPMMGVPFR